MPLNPKNGSTGKKNYAWALAGVTADLNVNKTKKLKVITCSVQYSTLIFVLYFIYIIKLMQDRLWW